MVDHHETLQRAIDAFNARDMNAMLAQFAPEAEVVTVIDGTFRGHESLADYWRQQWADVDATIELTAAQELAPELVVAAAIFVASAGGIEQRQELGWVFRFDGEKIMRTEVYASPGEARAAAAAEE